MSYKKTVSLTHEEELHKVNKATGEITVVKSKPNNLPDGKQRFEPKLMFAKTYSGVFKYLKDNLTPTEVVVVLGMIELATMNTNYLKPLHADSTIKEIAEVLGIHRNHVNKIMANLYKHGIYAKVSAMTTKGEKHWLVLNPYISFKGRTVSVELVDVFSNSSITEYVKGYKRLK